MNSVEIKKFLEKYKIFRELPEQYKSTKFCKLYYKMYEYILSIPKEKIVINHITRSFKNSEYISYLFYCTKCFLEAKDFYKWKDRIYSLLTEKLGPSLKKYKLLYNSKAKEFYNKIESNRKTTNLERYGKENYAQTEECKDKIKTTNRKNHNGKYNSQTEEWKIQFTNTMLERYNVKHALQSKKIQDKMKATCLEKYGKEYYTQTEECKEKMKAICLERYNKEYYAQTEECKEKISNTWKNKTKKEINEINEKRKATCLERHGKEYVSQVNEFKEKYKTTMLERYNVTNSYQIQEIRNKIKNNSHSNIADDMCLALDTLYGTLNSENTRYFTKNGEFLLKNEGNHNFYYDFTNVVEKWMVEFQGTYTHGLLEGQEYVWNTPVEEIYKRDEEKKLLAESKGYKVFYVYEDEYRKDPKGTIEKLIKEIKEYNTINIIL